MVYWKTAMKCFVYSLLTCLAKPWLAFKNNLTLCLRHQNSCAMGLRAQQSQMGGWKLVSRCKSEVLPNMLLWACNDPASSSLSVASMVAFAGSRILNHCNIWHAGKSPGKRLQRCLGTDTAAVEFQPGASWKNPRQSVRDLADLWHYIVYTGQYVINTQKISVLLPGVHLF